MIRRRESESLLQSAEVQEKREAWYTYFAGDESRGIKKEGGPWMHSSSTQEGPVIAFGFTLRIWWVKARLLWATRGRIKGALSAQVNYHSITAETLKGQGCRVWATCTRCLDVTRFKAKKKKSVQLMCCLVSPKDTSPTYIYWTFCMPFL